MYVCMSISFWPGNISLESSAFSSKSSGYDLKQGKLILLSWKREHKHRQCPCFHFSPGNALLKILKQILLLRHSSRRSGNEMHDSSSQQAKRKKIT